MADTHKAKKNRVDVLPTVPMSNLEAHVKLQQSQEEFLKWLEASEQTSPEHDGYSYKKVR